VGVPFNVAAYSLLTHVVANEADLRPGSFGHTIVDAHVYCGTGARGEWYGEHCPELQERLAAVEAREDYLQVREWLEGAAPAEDDEGYDHVPNLLEQCSREPRERPQIEVADRPMDELTAEDIGVEGYDPAPALSFEVAEEAVDADRDVVIALLAAVAENGVIGRDGEMPWHYPADLQHFRETTMGHPVVMGRVTYEAIVAGLGEPLPGRTSVVLTTRDLDVPERVVTADLVAGVVDAAVDALAAAQRTVYVVGGASVYEQFLPRADRLVLTEIHESYEGDTQFPAVDWSEWVERDRDDREDLSFLTYERP